MTFRIFVLNAATVIALYVGFTMVTSFFVRHAGLLAYSSPSLVSCTVHKKPVYGLGSP